MQLLDAHHAPSCSEGRSVIVTGNDFVRGKAAMSFAGQDVHEAQRACIQQLMDVRMFSDRENFPHLGQKVRRPDHHQADVTTRNGRHDLLPSPVSLCK